MKPYEVLVYFEENSYDIRCRCDVDTNKHFTRISPNVVHHYINDENRTRIFHVMFSGSEKDAKRFSEVLKLSYTGLGCVRNIMPRD